MATHRPKLLAATVSAVLVLGAHAASALTYTCTSVNRQDFLDPAGDRLSSRLEQPSINSSGDVVFVGRTRGKSHKIYLHPNAGAASVIAEEGGAAPGGSTYTKFADTSINAAGDIGFFGDLAIGEGVFVRPTGGPIEAAALTGGASPGGGAFFTFSDVSTVNSSGNIAFIAKVTGGPAGVFFYNSSANTVFTVALVGDSTGGGKQFCSFVNVALGGTDRVAFQAVTETTCGVSNDATTAIFREPIVLPGSFINVAEVGGATPVPTTTYAKFFDIDENDSGDVGFRAKYSGSTAGTGVFLFDAPATTTLISSTGDGAPRSGGFIKTLPQLSGITNTDQVAYRGKIKQGSAKHGVFVMGTSTDDAVVLNTDPVPADQWGTTARYRNIDEDAGVSRDAAWVTFISKVRDQQTPSGTGVFRCHGL